VEAESKKRKFDLKGKNMGLRKRGLRRLQNRYLGLWGGSMGKDHRGETQVRLVDFNLFDRKTVQKRGDAGQLR